MAAQQFNVLYNKKWSKDTNKLTVELWCYLHDWPVESGGLGKEEHFKNAAKLLWPEKSEGGKVAFIWHPWADEMLHAACTRMEVGLAGCGSSGKSDFLAIWCLLNWLAAPSSTLVLVTSTTIRDAKKRVWGAIQKYFYAWPSNMWPGKLTDAPTPAIRVRNEEGKFMDNAGIHLIPAEAKKSADTTGKMRGMKNKRVFLAADELSELGQAVVDTAQSNLANNDFFHMIGAANPNSYYDPFSKFVRPKVGWANIHVDMFSWETVTGGMCLHFDALKSPNWIAGENVWPILKNEKVQAALDKMSPTSLMFWRDYRGFWPQEGVDDVVMTEVEIMRYKGDQPPVWEGPTIKFASLDPSFTSGGDGAVLTIGEKGRCDGVEDVVGFTRQILLGEDMSNTTDTRSYQICARVKDILNSEGIDYRNFGVDITGGGTPFAEILARTLDSKAFVHVAFGGAASDEPVTTSEDIPAKDRYVNRVSELWFRAAEMLRAGRLRGITPEMAKQFSTRKYETRKGTSMRLLVESKIITKGRLGKSPDEADSAVIMLDVIAQRFRLRTSFRPAKGIPWRDHWKKYDVTGQSDRTLKR